MLMQSNTVIRRFESLPEISTSGKRINGLFRLMVGNRLLWEKAYEDIATNQGATTAGADGQSLEGFSWTWLPDIIARLCEGNYHFTPAKRVYIPKSHGKGKRPLGMAGAKDKWVQAVVKLLLDQIYEPVFSEHSHGFRTGRSCHTAVQEIKESWTGTNWFIDIDIKGFFDNISQDVLVSLLQRKIDDPRFIELIRQMLSAGYLEQWTFHNTYSGVPQGAIASPVMANIYLHELDNYLAELKVGFDQGSQRRRNPGYRSISQKIDTRRKKIDLLLDQGKQEQAATIKREIACLKAQRDKLASGDWFDPNYRRLRYCRYADDFLIGIIGSKADANRVKSQIIGFLEDTLRLEAATEKSKLSNALDGTTFLSYGISTWSAKKNRKVKIKRFGRHTTMRGGVHGIKLTVPHEKLVKFAREKGYGSMVGTINANHRPLMCNLSEYEIGMIYNAEMRGLANYYCLADDVKTKLNKLYFLWQTSLLKTLAAKHKTTVKAIAGRLKRDDHYAIRYVVNGADKFLSFYKLTDLKEKVFTYEQVDSTPNTYRLVLSHSEAIDRLNANECEYCGDTETPCEVHHVRKLKDMQGTPLWRWIKAARQRKRIVLCKECHTLLHQGRLPDNRSSGS